MKAQCHAVIVSPPSTASTDDLIPGLYDSLHRMARLKMMRESPGLTLQATALVHEAYLRIAGNGSCRWQGPGHLFSAIVEAMRRILIERARRVATVKHGGGLERVSFEADEIAAGAAPEELLALDRALKQLEKRNARQVQIVKLRYFGGLSIRETAALLGVSPGSVRNEWTFARAWLTREMSGTNPRSGGRRPS